MRTIYICGYGRSGSTLLGRVLAAREAGVALGEVTHLASERFLASALCSCGGAYPTCDFWRRVDGQLRSVSVPCSSLSQRRRRALEGVTGLLVPLCLLRRWVTSCALSEAYPGVPFAQGISVIAQAAGSVVVDMSKTTRLTANRPRLLHAAGMDLELALPCRPVGEIIASYMRAHKRRDRRMPVLLAVPLVVSSRLLALLAARRCARSLGVPLPRTPLEQASVMAAKEVTAGEKHHMLGGNRNRNLLVNEWTGLL